MLAGRRVVLGVTGGIAAYKAIELCRRDGLNVTDMKQSIYARSPTGRPLPLYARERQALAWTLRMRWRDCQMRVQPSYPEVAQMLGLASHASAIDAARRESRRRGGYVPKEVA